MSPYLCAIFLLGLSSLATAANFTLVYEWPDGLDYEWPSEASKTQAWRDGTLKPWEIEPLYMAVYGSRLFFSLESKYPEISVTLVSLPTSGASSAPPKLTPFPSWDMHRIGDCNMIEYATGLQVESVGRLWVLDGGSSHCKSKLWIFDLKKNDHNNLVHQIRNPYPMHDFVLDETAHGTFAYISRWYQQSIVVFSLEKNLFWIVETAEIFVFSIALSPKDQEPRQLYLGIYDSTELYSISIATLHNGNRTAEPELIGHWNAASYRMLMDNQGILYSAFKSTNYILSWNTSQLFWEQYFHELQIAGTNCYEWPFTFALDKNGTFWMIEKKPTYIRLLKVALKEKSSKALPVTPANPTNSTTSIPQKTCVCSPSTTTAAEVQENSILKEKLSHHQLFNVILICTNIFTVTLFWFILRKRETIPFHKIPLRQTK